MRIIGWVVLLATVLSSANVRAQNKSDPAVEQGLELRRQGRDAEALALFRQAYDARPVPRTMAQIALAEQALGKWVDAERDLELALAVKDDPWISNHRETLLKALDTIRKHLATLDVKANTEGAELWVNGAKVGPLPVHSLRVPSGPVDIEVRSEGYDPLIWSIDLAPGQTASEDFQLRTPQAPAPSPRSGENQPPGSASTSSAPLEAPTATGVSTKTAFAWGTLGAAGAFLGGALVAQVIHEEQAANYDDDARCSPMSREEQCGVYRGKAESAQLFANIGYIAAGAFGIGSAILFFVVPEKKKPAAADWRVNVGTSGATFTLTGQF
jgi:PEGA domain-containing protein